MVALLIVLVAVIAAYKYVQLSNIDGHPDRMAAGESVLLDVRTASEYDGGHIEGAINIPLGRLRTDYVRLDPKRTYITYCSHGLRSVKAAGILKERGFKRVFNGGPMSNVEALRRSPTAKRNN
jgi:rhodanese-related sulfurtransferase